MRERWEAGRPAATDLRGGPPTPRQPAIAARFSNRLISTKFTPLLTSILTTARYTHLTDQTKHHAIDRINGLMDGFGITWGKVK